MVVYFILFPISCRNVTNIFATSGFKHVPLYPDAFLVIIGLLLSTSPKQSTLNTHFVLEYTRHLGENQ